MTRDTSSGWSLKRHRDFFLFLGARSLSSAAIRIQAVAVGWQVYTVTQSAFDLGLVGLAVFLPFIVLVLPAGHVADHFDRRFVAAFCLGLQMVSALALLWISWHGLSSVWPVCFVMALFGASRAFYIPVMQALVPNLVEVDMLNRAVALNATATQVALVVGPAIGGVLYLLGPLALYWIVASIFAATVLMMLAIKRGAHTPPQREPATWATVLSGLHFVRSKPIILGAMSLDLFAVLFGGAIALLPIYASDILHVGPEGLGLLRAAPGVGATLCAFWLTAHPITRHAGKWMLYAVALYGAATLVFGISTSFVVALIALFTTGAADMVNVYIRNMLIQLETPDAIRGRVNAVSAVFIGASNELGEFESGLLASWVGAVRSVVIGGVLTLGITAYWAKLFPELRKMDRFTH